VAAPREIAPLRSAPETRGWAPREQATPPSFRHLHSAGL